MAIEDVSDVINTNEFTVYDYLVFAAMLLASSCIGIYFACGGKQTSTNEYLMAGRDMNWFPIFVSLLASYLSAITLLGVPSEVYTYGIQYIVLCISYFFLIAIVGIIFMPIFYNLSIVSANEYLERRFNVAVRYLGFGLFMTQYILYLSVVLYAPSLALEAVAKVPIYVTIVSTGLVCTFYTTLGGMKAVIWTDVFQAGVMVTGLIVVIIVGVIQLDGFGEVFRIASEGGRLKVFDFDPDPRTRNSFWTLTIGGAFTAMPVWTICQPSVQRFQAAKSLAESKKAIYWNIPGLIFIVLLCVMDGLVIYGVYAECDIGKFGWADQVISNDQVLPYFILHKLGEYPGVPGLFTSCLFSGALSTCSSGLNSMAAVALEDVIKKVKPDITDKRSTILSKCIACSLGLLVIGLAFAVSAFGTMVLQLSYSIYGIIGGPYLGVFSLGILVPWANWKGAFSGVIVGVCSTLWLAIGAQKYPPNKHEAMVKATGCKSFINMTVANFTDPERIELFKKFDVNGIRYPANEFTEYDFPAADWYAISYLWYAAIGVSFTFVTGMIMSWVFNVILKEEPGEVKKELLFNYGEFFDWLKHLCCRGHHYEIAAKRKKNDLMKSKENEKMLMKLEEL